MSGPPPSARGDRAARGIDPGLCGTCTHARTIVSGRGADFFLCRLSATDPRFPRYPRLPVVGCRGWSPVDPSSAAAGQD
ncbi:MAG TPA: hypothetical protein VMN39_07120 [Longimicrobiaceae bacterium]|nr:hypothetical protein [Longimicrobiaceae bacterium]